MLRIHSTRLPRFDPDFKLSLSADPRLADCQLAHHVAETYNSRELSEPSESQGLLPTSLEGGYSDMFDKDKTWDSLLIAGDLIRR